MRAADEGHGRILSGYVVPPMTGGARRGTLPSMQSEPIHPAVRVGHVHLKVADLDRSLAFYRDALGLNLTADGRPVGLEAAFLAAGDYHHHIGLNTWESAGATPPPPGHTGLYHVAFVYPDRRELGKAVQRLIDHGYAPDHATDHGGTVSVYLDDPDGNGIELYADRPRDVWPPPQPGFQVGMFTAPLDLEDLVRAAPGEEAPRQVGEGLTLGHMHLHVGDIDEAMRFYRDVIGFDSMAELPGAAFVSAGGYHHHLGFNTWQGQGAPPAPADAVGLRYWTLRLDGDDELAQVRARIDAAGIPTEEHPEGLLVRDPFGNAVVLTT